MLVYKTQTDETHRTDLGNMKVTWHIRAGVPYIAFIDDYTSAKPAYRWPDLPMPSCRTGHIAFEPEEYPTLAEAIELLPEYETTLWEHVRNDLRVALASKTSAESCSAARAFTPEEERRWRSSVGK